MMSFILREIKEEDFSNGFFETLSNLSEVDMISNRIDKAKEILKRISKDKNYRIIIAEDKEKHQVIGTCNIIDRTKIYS